MSGNDPLSKNILDVVVVRDPGVASRYKKAKRRRSRISSKTT